MMNQNSKPDYKRIYQDLINLKHPEKKESCSHILSKKELSVMDIIEISQILSEQSEDDFSFNQRHRAYDDDAIIEILNYQKEHGMTNTKVARHFNVSRNTVAKWKNKFPAYKNTSV